MAPQDAFGRELDEDVLGSMGWNAPGDAVTSSATAPAPPATTLTPPASRTPFSPTPLRSMPGGAPRSGHTGAIAALFGLVVLGAVVWFVVGVVGTIHAPSIKLPDISTPKIGQSAKPPTGLSEKSLLRRGNLSPALRELQDKLGGRVRLLRIEAERVDVEVVGAGGRMTNAQYRWDADSPSIISQTSGGTGVQTFAWSQINASAPARLVRATGRPTDFNYAVLLDAAGLRWSGYTTGGKGYLADDNGRAVKPIGG
jgi:hypothetical protein